MAESQLVDEWLKKAEEDYAFAASVLEDSTFYAQICFHFHQAAEKYLKAFIVARDLECPEDSRFDGSVKAVFSCRTRFRRNLW